MGTLLPFHQSRRNKCSGSHKKDVRSDFCSRVRKWSSPTISQLRMNLGNSRYTQYIVQYLSHVLVWSAKYSPLLLRIAPRTILNQISPPTSPDVAQGSVVTPYRQWASDATDASRYRASWSNALSRARSLTGRDNNALATAHLRHVERCYSILKEKRIV